MVIKQINYKITENRKIAEKTYEMVLEGDTSAITRPGQFVNFKLDGLFLRRPISVCSFKDNELTVIYKVVGQGTEHMSNMKHGDIIDTLTGLGNGYTVKKDSKKPLLIGGGVGIPPMYQLAKEHISLGITPKVILGFNKKDEVFYKEEFENLGLKIGESLFITTADGSLGIKGFVTDVMKGLDYDYFYTCGPMAMFKSIEVIAKTSGQYSFEERMGCGFGACMGCSCKTKYGYKRICKDGPVLEREEIIW